MFKVVAQQRAWWPITFAGVTEEGVVVENRFDVRFTILDEDENDAFMADAASLLGNNVPEKWKGKPSTHVMAEFVQRIACDWRGVAEENDDPIKFTEENLRRVMRVPNAFKGVMAGYVACRSGRAEARAGN
ncbi:hypothetical protein [Sphingobium aquiterrae]|uniref:hypothetical protein n=1 Tax=Sphingobium aquiterrae TaxID=2038656 RepID=UPI00301AF966